MSLRVGRFNRRVEKWCTWEEQQWRFTMRTFKVQGLELPGAAPALVAKCIAGRPLVAGQATEDHNDVESPGDRGSQAPGQATVLQEVQHNEPAPQIDEEVTHTTVQLEADKVFAHHAKGRIFARELLES